MANETIEEQRERDYQFHLDIAAKIAPTWEKRRAEIEEASAPVRRWMLRELDPQQGDTRPRARRRGRRHRLRGGRDHR